MKIVYWDIRGLNDLNRRDIVKKKVSNLKSIILLLEETETQQCSDLISLKYWGNKHVKWVDSPSQGSNGGIYVPCASHTEEVKLFWREIEEVRFFWNYPWVIGEVFNEILFVHKRSSSSASIIGMKKFNSFISKHQLVYIPIIGASFAWTNNQLQSVRSRIIRILIYIPWELEYPNVIQQALPIPVSDHRPITLICDGLKCGPSPFRCNAWFVLCKKLQLLNPKLKEWSKQEYGELDRKLEELAEIFNNLDIKMFLNNGLSAEQWDERVASKQE